MSTSPTNNTNLIGYLAGDPALKTLPTGTSVAELRVGVSQAGNSREDAGFFDGDCSRNCVGLDERDVHVYIQREVFISASEGSCTAWRRRRAPRRADGAPLGGARASGLEPGAGGRGR